MKYYKKVNGAIQLTPTGEYVLDYLGLTTDNLREMSSHELVGHCKKFSDILNDGRIIKNTYIKGDYQQNRNGVFLGQLGHSGIQGYNDSGSFSRYFSLDSWWTQKLKELPKGVQKTFPFLIIPKASKSEKNKGCENMEKQVGHNRFDTCAVCGGYILQNPNRPSACKCENPVRQDNKMVGNFHPTVKPIKLFSYLITLASRPNDLVLDPFLGSGTCALACSKLGRKFIGIELDSEYYKIAEARIQENNIQRKMLEW